MTKGNLQKDKRDKAPSRLGRHGSRQAWWPEQEAERSHLTKYEAVIPSAMMFSLQQNCTFQSSLNRPTRDQAFKCQHQWGTFLMQNTKVDEPEALNSESWILSPNRFSL